MALPSLPRRDTMARRATTLDPACVRNGRRCDQSTARKRQRRPDYPVLGSRCRCTVHGLSVVIDRWAVTIAIASGELRQVPTI